MILYKPTYNLRNKFYAERHALIKIPAEKFLQGFLSMLKCYFTSTKLSSIFTSAILSLKSIPKTDNCDFV